MSQNEVILHQLLEQLTGEKWVREHFFAKEAFKRNWRLDIAQIETKIAVEIHGGEFRRGRHNRPVGFLGDCEKARAAALLGWAWMPFGGSEITRDPYGCAAQIMEVLNRRRGNPSVGFEFPRKRYGKHRVANRRRRKNRPAS